MQTLPPALARRLRQVLHLPATPGDLAELASLWREARPIRLEALFSDHPTPHRVIWGDRSGWTLCVLDALMLPFMDGRPVEVETTTPAGGHTIRLRASTQDLQSTHPDAVISLGVAVGREGEVKDVCCPHILAFVDRSEYEQWCQSHPDVASIALPLRQAWLFAGRLIGSHPDTPGADPTGGVSCHGCC